jgi:AraC family transcriptional regulator, arabinose operon regulatory protein
MQPDTGMPLPKMQVADTPKKKEGFEGQRTIILPATKQKFCSQHIFCRNLYITDIGYYPNAAFHNRERENGCAEYILIHCVKGKGWYSMGNKRYNVTSNDFFIIPAGTAHKYGADIADPWTIFWVHFTGAFARFYFNLLTKSRKAGPMHAIVNTSRNLLFYDIIQHLELMNDTGNIIYSNSCLYAYLSSFQPSEMKISINENDIIQDCITYMKENLDKKLKLDDISAKAKISSSHLAAIFKKRMKYSPIHLYTSFKVQRACQMLMDNSHNVKTIAYSLGYDDQYHFSRVFKTIMGVSPKNFKGK